MRYKILQVNNLDKCKYLFRDFSFASNNGLNLNDYKIIYQGDVYEGGISDNLDYLFIKFNTNHPEDFHGHSLSVSDIVQLDNEYYYCDTTGWVRIL